MAKDKKMNLENKLGEIGLINQVTQGINKSTSPIQKVPLYNLLTSILSAGDQELFRTMYEDIRISPEEAVRYGMEGVQNRIEEVKEEYNKNKKSLSKKVISAINKGLKRAEDDTEVANKMFNYLSGIVDIPEFNQLLADRMAQQDVASRLKINMNFSARGDKTTYEGIIIRTLAKQFVEKNKDGKYKVKDEVIKEYMDNIETGSLLYKNVFSQKD